MQRKINLIHPFWAMAIFVFSIGEAFGQNKNIFQIGRKSEYNYFVVNDNKTLVNQINLESKDTLNCDKQTFSAQLFNVFLSDSRLVLFSVLPSGQTGKYEYAKISLDTIQSYLIDFRQLDSIQKVNLSKFNTSDYHNSKLVKLSNLKIVVKKADGYYVNSSDCLTEFFEIGHYGPNNGFNNQNNIALIDVKNIPLTTRAFEKQYASVNSGKRSFNHSDYGGMSQLNNKDAILFYSHETGNGDNKNYYFWTLMNWTMHIPNIKRGIDRFIYNPQLGIVAGDYTFYFKSLRKVALSEACEEKDFNDYLSEKMKLYPIKIFTDINKVK